MTTPPPFNSKADNLALHNARRAKKDEFYTQLTDIEKELKFYNPHFKGKVVLCNCDDPEESNFWVYFRDNFEYLGLKKLISTHYEVGKQSYKMELIGARYEDGELKFDNFIKTPLKGDGDFRSEECVEILKEADIIVTNPPFSLFREYVAQLMAYKKSFLIIGNQNAITYKDIFPHIRNNTMWLGYGFKGNAAHFISKYDDVATAGDHREGMIRVSGVTWFTNLEIQKRHEDLILYKRYTPEEYPTYDNYDAINVNKTAEIPCDYDGIMGVPITFLDKFNPDQFEILGMSASAGYKPEIVGIAFNGEKDARPLINGKNTFARIFIKRKR